MSRQPAVLQGARRSSESHRKEGRRRWVAHIQLQSSKEWLLGSLWDEPAEQGHIVRSQEGRGWWSTSMLWGSCTMPPSWFTRECGAGRSCSLFPCLPHILLATVAPGAECCWRVQKRDSAGHQHLVTSEGVTGTTTTSFGLLWLQP